MTKIASLAAAVALLLNCAVARAADSQLFIQVWFDPHTTIPIDGADDPGRVEVTVAGKFVGCALAAFHEDKWDRTHLVPISLGYSAVGRKEDVRVQVMGALGKFGIPNVKITESPLEAPTEKR